MDGAGTTMKVRSIRVNRTVYVMKPAMIIKETCGYKDDVTGKGWSRSSPPGDFVSPRHVGMHLKTALFIKVLHLNI